MFSRLADTGTPRSWVTLAGMSDILVYSVEHRDGCPAVEADAIRCRCAPTVYRSYGEDRVRVATLPQGWTRGDLAAIVTRPIPPNAPRVPASR